ncbi:MAG: hypothetical protein ACOC0P_03495, partial [Planctomycetota bacterium]
NETTAGHQFDVSIAADHDSSLLLVTWTAMHEEGDTRAAGSMIKGRLFDGRTGEPLSDEMALADGLALQDGGGWLASSTNNNDDNGAETAIAGTFAAHRNVRPVAVGSGQFVIAWDAQDDSGTPAGSHLRVVDALGFSGMLGPIVRLGGSDGQSIEPAIAATSIERDNGTSHAGVVAAWMQQREDGSGYDVLASRFKLDPMQPLTLTPTGSAIAIDTSPIPADRDGWRSGVEVAMGPDGRFVVAWNQFGRKTSDDPSRYTRPWAPADVVARAFSSTGRPLTAEPVIVHASTEKQQRLEIGSNTTRAKWTDQGVLAFAWAGNTPEDDGNGIGLTMFTPRDLKVPTPRDADLADAGAPFNVSKDRFLAQVAEAGYGPGVTAALARRTELDASGVTTSTTGPAVRARAGAGLSKDDPVLESLGDYPVWDPTWTPLIPQDYPDPAGPDDGFNAMFQMGWIPADPDIAAGPNHLVTVVNQDMAIYTKEGEQTFFTNLVTFFADLGAESFVFDPIAVYDVYEDRFVIAAAEGASTGSWICLAVSDDDDPNGEWYKYRFRADFGDFLDFPNMGIDANAIYISADYFGDPTGNWIHIIEKAPLLTGEPASITNAVQTAGFTRSLGAITTYDADAPAQYFATTYSGNDQVLALEAIRDPLGTPIRDTFSLIVPRFAFPPDVPQLGTTNLADSIDWRIKHGVYRNGSLWLAHNTGVDGLARARWYQIRMNGWPASGNEPELVQSGDVDLGPDIYTWFPDLGVDDEGNMVITYNRSSINEYIGIWRSTRRVYDRSGRLREAAPLQTSTSPENGNRWGDYSGIDEDPVNPGVFWSHTMFRVGAWQTWVGRVDSRQTMLLESGPLIAGQPADVTCRGAAAGSTVYLAYSFTGEGSTPVPSFSVTLDLDGARLAGTATTDSTGIADFSQSLTIPANAPTRLIWLQAFEFGNTSHVVLSQLNGN